MDSCLIEIDGIEVILKKSNRAKRINIKVKPYESVCVTVPGRLSFKKAEEFARKYSDWISKNKEKVKKHENSLITFDESTDFQTRNHILEIEKADVKTTSARVSKNKILVKYPENQNISNYENQKTIKSAITRAYRKEAQEYLPQRLDELSKNHHLPYKGLAIKNLRSRWGSCSYDNNINLNLNLMKLPNELIDYVILHELAHTVQKNHSPKFWQFLEKICPNSKDLNKQLKNFRPLF